MKRSATKRCDITMQPRLSILHEYTNTILDTLKLPFLNFTTFIQPYSYTGTDFTSESWLTTEHEAQNYLSFGRLFSLYIAIASH